MCTAVGNSAHITRDTSADAPSHTGAIRLPVNDPTNLQPLCSAAISAATSNAHHAVGTCARREATHQSIHQSTAHYDTRVTSPHLPSTFSTNIASTSSCSTEHSQSINNATTTVASLPSQPAALPCRPPDDELTAARHITHLTPLPHPLVVAFPPLLPLTPPCVLLRHCTLTTTSPLLSSRHNQSIPPPLHLSHHTTTDLPTPPPPLTLPPHPVCPYCTPHRGGTLRSSIRMTGSWPVPRRRHRRTRPLQCRRHTRPPPRPPSHHVLLDAAIRPSLYRAPHSPPPPPPPLPPLTHRLTRTRHIRRTR